MNEPISHQKIRKRMHVAHTLWAGAVVFLLVLLYCVTLWGYRASRFPHQFENFIQETQLWRILGKKSYSNFGSVGGVSIPVDPRFQEVVEDTVYQFTVEGYLTGLEVEGEIIRKFVIEKMDVEPLVIEGSYEVDRAWKQICLNSEDCENMVYAPVSLETVQTGQWVQIEMIRSEGGSWRISNLFVGTV